ncbi:MAG: hypothetical protein IPM34_13475 [Saprospiraceae bacterium]|nr:hypothetical protein [Saprospiraceae bacterium]
MNPEKETRLLLIFISVGYIANFCLGILGSFFPWESFEQMTSWQIGDSMAIMASVLASRQVGSRGQNLASPFGVGYILLGIAYGVSFASSSVSAINNEKMATVLLPLLPAIVLISFCRIYPAWLRRGSLLIFFPFFFMYWNVVNGTYSHDNLSNTLAYTGIQFLGVLWVVYLWKDYRSLSLNKE